MKCTKKSVRERMPRLTDLRGDYIIDGYSGRLNGRTLLTAVCVDYDPDTGCCTDITPYGVGDGMTANHYRGVGCVECRDIFCDWMRGEIDRAECIDRICARVNAQFDEAHILTGNPRSKIARMRMARGLTQTQLAKQIGVAQSHLARWECGGRNPKTNVLIKIAGILGCDINDLI